MRLKFHIDRDCSGHGAGLALNRTDTSRGNYRGAEQAIARGRLREKA